MMIHARAAHEERKSGPCIEFSSPTGHVTFAEWCPSAAWCCLLRSKLRSRGALHKTTEALSARRAKVDDYPACYLSGYRHEGYRLAAHSAL